MPAASVSPQSLAALLAQPARFESAAAPASAALQALAPQLKTAQQRLAALPPHAVPMVGVDDRMVSLLQSWLAGEGTQHGVQLVPVRDGFEARFDNLDPNWIQTFVRHCLAGARPGFVEPLAPQPLADEARIAIVGDWGSGLYGAPLCAQAIDARHAQRPWHLVLHLGDIYYAGAEAEVRERFLAHWPRAPGALHRALNGNHEMYLDGRAYFGTLLPEARFQQPASAWALRNAHWLLVGLDTAYADHDLYGTQAAWLLALADAHPAHRLMLFSHHQPFSAFESQGFRLQQRLGALLAGGRVAAWYWGHEHLAARYDRHAQWQMHGRCVGHGGFPYFRFLNNGRPAATGWHRFEPRRGAPGGWVLDGPNPHVAGQESLYGPHGWLGLELTGPRVHETWYSATGDVQFEQDIDAATAPPAPSPGP